MRVRWWLLPVVGLLAACGSGIGSRAGGTRVCIVSPLDHPSLGAAIEGFRSRLVSAMPRKSIAFQSLNAGGDMSQVPGLLNQAIRHRCALVFVVTTQAAQLARRMVAERGIPVVYTAVTDPVGAGIVQSMDGDTLPITGVTDLFPVDAQIALFLAADPKAKSAAIMFNPKEQNSQVLVAKTEAALRARGIATSRHTATEPGAVPEVARAAARSADILIVNGDNLFTGALDAVIAAAEAAHKPLFVGDAESVRRGGVATVGPDYRLLGEKAADKAFVILSGKRTAGQIASEDPTSYSFYINVRAAQSMGLQLPLNTFQAAPVWVGTN
jgi:putative ABC transport system substrate-binding protein